MVRGAGLARGVILTSIFSDPSDKPTQPDRYLGRGSES